MLNTPINPNGDSIYAHMVPKRMDRLIARGSIYSIRRKCFPYSAVGARASHGDLLSRDTNGKGAKARRDHEREDLAIAPTNPV